MRPLRTLNSVPGIKNLVTTIYDAAGLLQDVLWLVAFLLFLFSVVGLQFFMGKLRHVCYSPLGVASKATCGTCAAGWTCAESGKNPDYGYTNFDNAGSSMLAVFMIMTQVPF
jgi:uncharacterized membrane protein